MEESTEAKDITISGISLLTMLLKGEHKMNTLYIFILVVFIFNFVSCSKSDKEKCEKKGAPWKWDAEQKRCVNPSSPDGGTEEEIIFTNAYADIVSVESGGQSIDLAKGECVKIHQDHLGKLKIRKFGVFSSGSTTSVGPVCDNSDAKTDNDCPFNTNKDYKIVAKPDGPASWAIQEVDKGDSDSTNCKTLLSPTSTTGTGTGSTTGTGTGEEVANQKPEPRLIKEYRCYKGTLLMQFQIFKPPTGNVFNTPIPADAICSVSVNDMFNYTLHAEFYGNTLQECENRLTERMDDFKKAGLRCKKDYIDPDLTD